MHDLIKLATEHLPCTYCGVIAGRRCRTVSGNRAGRAVARYTHEARLGPARELWFAGLDDGQREAADLLGQQLGPNGYGSDAGVITYALAAEHGAPLELTRVGVTFDRLAELLAWAAAPAVAESPALTNHYRTELGLKPLPEEE